MCGSWLGALRGRNPDAPHDDASYGREVDLVWPALDYLPSYVDALERGWSPDNVRLAAGQDELRAIGRDAAGFVRSLVDREATGGPIALPDGSHAARLPGYRRWMWDGDFCGSIGLRCNV